MNKQDSVFFNVFSLVIGILVAIALVLFAFARMVGENKQRAQVLEDSRYQEAVRENIRPFGRIAVAGEDNSALVIASTSHSPAGTSVEIPTDGAGAYTAACVSCHGAGIAGAPKAFDRSAWSARIAQGKETLYRRAIEGYQGSAGVMPAKGGRNDLPDELVRRAVDYMLEFK